MKNREQVTVSVKELEIVLVERPKLENPGYLEDET